MAKLQLLGLPICMFIITIISININISLAREPIMEMNIIDKCWRWNPHWRNNRQQLSSCSVGFVGKMINNMGTDMVFYEVTDSSDDPLNPKPGTLRYGATIIKGKVWISFQRDMRISLRAPILISSFTAIDGRGASVHIVGPACLLVYKSTDVIIHGLIIHHCRPRPAMSVIGPDSQILQMGQVDGDAIRLVTARKVWVDHNTLYECYDGLLDVTRGTTNVTVSNNWFRNQDKVMLLGHDDGYLRDKNMKVTVAFNHFGPNCNQRMPRVRHGYAHVVNNLYLGWTQYAIGGSMNPSIKSEANFFIAVAAQENKEVTWRKHNKKDKVGWSLYSVRDYFKNGASFTQSGLGGARPNYDPQQSFRVSDAKYVRVSTESAGALHCTKTSIC